PARDVRVRAHFPRHGRVAQMDLVAVHERATELIAEVERARDERQTKFRPLAFFSAMFSRSFWRLALRSLRTGSSLSDASPEVRVAYERVFGGPPEGDEFGARAVRSANPPKFVADSLYLEAPLTPAQIDLLDAVHARYVADTGLFDRGKHLTGLLGVVALAGKLVP